MGLLLLQDPMFKFTLLEVKIIPGFLANFSLFLLILGYFFPLFLNMDASEGLQLFGSKTKKKVEDFQGSVNEYQMQEDILKQKRKNLIDLLRSVADDLDKHKKE